jgi:hypothetical protein
MSTFPTTVLRATAQRRSPGGARSQKGTRIVRCTSYYQRSETTHTLSQGSAPC